MESAPAWTALAGNPSSPTDLPTTACPICSSSRWTAVPRVAASTWLGPKRRAKGFEVGRKPVPWTASRPEGHYEWFAGYARVEGEPDSGIAVAVMTCWRAVRIERLLDRGHAALLVGAPRRPAGASGGILRDGPRERQEGVHRGRPGRVVGATLAPPVEPSKAQRFLRFAGRRRLFEVCLPGFGRCREIHMKLVPILSLRCRARRDARRLRFHRPQDVTKTVVDTVFTDRFAQNKAVVWGEWALSLKSKSDSGNVVFVQDTTDVTAYIFWQKSPRQWIMDGSITSQTMRLTQDTLLLSGKSVDSAAGKKTKIIGILFNTGNAPTSDSFTAVRTN